jgi:membrane associated rhomboid family serine protease
VSIQRDVDKPSTWVQAAMLSGGFVALLWVIEIVDASMNHRLDQYGVEPRDAEGLLGILFAPMLHAGWEHLSANTVPALILGFLALASGIVRGLEATGIIWFVCGVGVWLVAPSDTIHLGASGLIFGWLVYLMIRGIFTHRIGEIILGMVLFFVYGGLLLGVLPGQPGVSWQGHLFGAIGGGIAAWLVGLDERTERASVI